MRLLALAGEVAATVAQIRLATPLQALCAQRGWTLVLKSFHDCAAADLAQADVLIVQRADSARVLRLQRRMRQRGGAVVHDIDDLLTEIPDHISNQAVVRSRVRCLRQCLIEADVISVSTARLGRELGLPRCMEVPNHGWGQGEGALPSQHQSAPVTLLFASSDRLATDFIYAAVRAQVGVQVEVVGPPGEDFELAGVQVRRHPLMARAAFMDFARSLPNPLAVIPLEDSRFAACKSAVKWFDYALAGVPTLCSAVSPYLELITNEVTGTLVANEVPAWTAALQRAVADADWRLRVAQAARAQVLAGHGLDHSVSAWERAIRAARDHRASLTLPAPGRAARLLDGISDALHAGARQLRVLNRARLARRARR